MKSEMFAPQFRKEPVNSLEDKKTDELQQKLLEVMRLTDTEENEKDNEAKREAVKKEYMNVYPDQLEGVELIFGMKEFLELQKRIKSQDRENSSWEEIKKILKQLTEYQFIITHYLLEAGDTLGGKGFLNKFWQLSERIAQESGNLEQFIASKKGILGQAASFRVLDQLGFQPKLPHPNLDAFYSVDLLTKENVAVQIKSHFAKEPVLLGIEDVEEIGVPAVITNQNGEQVFINERHSQALQKFKINLKRLEKLTHEKYRGIEFLIPINMINENNGEPNEYVVKYFKRELEKRLGGQQLSKAA